MKVGIIGHGFIGWNGGVDFIRNVARALHASAREGDSLIVLLPWQGSVESIPPCYSEFRTDFGAEFDVALVLHTEEGFKAALTLHGIDVLLPALQVLPPWIEVPWVGYLADFQHKYIPQLFSEQDIQYRDIAFNDMLTAAKTIIVNSESVAKDAQLFFPHSQTRIFAQPFGAGTHQRWFALPNTSAFMPDRPYLIICNQFWVHKDHLTAFRAFAAVANQFPDLQLICTGPVSDHRHPHYADAIRHVLVELGIAERVRILGCIPKDDQIILLKNALALVQPTLFEGGPGGGAVYDAVALGVPCLVSNIPVNVELEEDLVTFFNSGDPGHLALKLREFLTSPQPQRLAAAVIEEAGLARRKRCGRVLWNAIDDRLAQARESAPATAETHPRRTA